MSYSPAVPQAADVAAAQRDALEEQYKKQRRNYRTETSKVVPLKSAGLASIQMWKRPGSGSGAHRSSSIAKKEGDDLENHVKG